MTKVKETRDQNQDPDARDRDRRTRLRVGDPPTLDEIKRARSQFTSGSGE